MEQRTPYKVGSLMMANRLTDAVVEAYKEAWENVRGPDFLLGFAIKDPSGFREFLQEINPTIPVESWEKDIGLIISDEVTFIIRNKSPLELKPEKRPIDMSQDKMIQDIHWLLDSL